MRGKNKLIFKPNKKLGQNFLSDDNFLKKIVNSFSLTKKTKIIEIGPGYGSLTRILLEYTSNPVICIEKDENLFNFLNSSDLSKKLNVKFVLKDVLDIDWQEFLKQENIYSDDDLIVIGNLPYNISNFLIEKLIKKRHLFKKFIFLVQKEVAQRWVADPFNYKNKYSNFSIFVNYFCKTSLVFEVPKIFFKPMPKVDGALVVLEIEEKYKDLIIDEEKFFLFVRNCFRFRRKTLFNNIKDIFEEEAVKRVLRHELNYDIKIRPHFIDISHYLILFDKLSTSTKKYVK